MPPTSSREKSVATQQPTDSVEPANPIARSDESTESRFKLSRVMKRPVALWLAVAAACVGIFAAYVFRSEWLPQARQMLTSVQAGWQDNESELHDAHVGIGIAQEQASGASSTSLKLSEQAQRNVGLQLSKVRLQDFDRTINVPAMVTELPGQTNTNVSSPMTGIVTRIYPIHGEAVKPGQPLFRLRLTHEDVVDAQSRFLETIEQLDVVKREVTRLVEITTSGAVAGKRLLERQYEQQQIEARLRAQGQALILHGLTEEQLDAIQSSRRLLQQVTVFAPPATGPAEPEASDHWLQVTEVGVQPGQHVNSGDLLCVLSDHAMLYIEGKGFEEDSEKLNEAANRGTPITALIEAKGSGTYTVPDLRILYLENQVELDSRALLFYVRLPNELIRNEQTDDGHRFIGWRFKLGQRVDLAIPIERWENRIVLPVDAVVKEGVEWFVFQKNGGRFDRRPVHVEYRDQRWAVIASDGSLYPGDTVATAGAYQMHLAMKNKSGGGVDPHAGHNH
jgi:cobalt-zinc-cadmium efflux system membrane fusion protein